MFNSRQGSSTNTETERGDAGMMVGDQHCYEKTATKKCQDKMAMKRKIF